MDRGRGSWFGLRDGGGGVGGRLAPCFQLSGIRRRLGSKTQRGMNLTHSHSGRHFSPLFFFYNNPQPSLPTLRLFLRTRVPPLPQLQFSILFPKHLQSQEDSPLFCQPFLIYLCPSHKSACLEDKMDAVGWVESRPRHPVEVPGVTVQE